MSIFEKILRKEIPANIIYEDDYAIAFPDIAPQAPIHILVVPKHPAKNFSDTAQWSPEARAGYMQSINQVIAQLNLTDGYRLVFNTGEDGGQTVDYLHLHILAGKAMSWPPFPL
ncbi:histidine triad nucleotide-binding protein [Entomospira culicis]|uniref:Histidine triad nucleotide-binding protein n=1 Tax=Entomospira culicis TaxID=2719989 RepID=A0A968GHL7_9SPIO|nr:histidine triad nucleotide-binding protein [Entomospira culicis]NIZ18967.1 histidine triad nucleotide-binding protein [Entomospira culicis]NIZ69182.1 histidine triad nucleotide-binding protein [Entomospira culicis]WDI37769.1 histidine triad nucleotide-binding protein [Entomospira culicis]WDI39397.1 histidine triad nucleotide-binding protein [Entomospira culicis]